MVKMRQRCSGSDDAGRAGTLWIEVFVGGEGGCAKAVVRHKAAQTIRRSLRQAMAAKGWDADGRWARITKERTAGVAERDLHGTAMLSLSNALNLLNAPKEKQDEVGRVMLAMMVSGMDSSKTNHGGRKEEKGRGGTGNWKRR